MITVRIQLLLSMFYVGSDYMMNMKGRSQFSVSTLTGKSIAAQLKKADIALYTALAIALIVCGTACLVAYTDRASVPPDFKLIPLTEHHQAYNIYRNGSLLMLQRTRGAQQALLIAFFSFIST